MVNLPFYIPFLFVGTTLLTLFFIAKAFGYSKKISAILMAWLIAQGFIAGTGFYTDASALPPRVIFALAPPIAAIVFLLATKKGGKIIDSSISPGTLTLLHIVRIPVEIVLFMLFTNKTIPILMTFEGSNYDIVSGITAPFIYYFGFIKNNISPAFITVWNIICLALLANIVVTAVLCFPFPFQQFAFEQPNIAIMYAPYIWLPSFIVPAVLFSHLVVLRQIKTKRMG